LNRKTPWLYGHPITTIRYKKMLSFVEFDKTPNLMILQIKEYLRVMQFLYIGGPLVVVVVVTVEYILLSASIPTPNEYLKGGARKPNPEMILRLGHNRPADNLITRLESYMPSRARTILDILSLDAT
jgi:hypothetical protein